MIKGVQIKDLKVNYDTRGHLMEVLRRDDKILRNSGKSISQQLYQGL